MTKKSIETQSMTREECLARENEAAKFALQMIKDVKTSPFFPQLKIIHKSPFGFNCDQYPRSTPDGGTCSREEKFMTCPLDGIEEEQLSGDYSNLLNTIY